MSLKAPFVIAEQHRQHSPTRRPQCQCGGIPAANESLLCVLYGLLWRSSWWAMLLQLCPPRRAHPHVINMMGIMEGQCTIAMAVIGPTTPAATITSLRKTPVSAQSCKYVTPPRSPAETTQLTKYEIKQVSHCYVIAITLCISNN